MFGTAENTVIGSSRCPECAKQGRDTSGDNLIQYKDGHAYCFACQYYQPSGKSIANLENSVKKPLDKPPKKVVLPPDATTDIEAEGLTWLAKYGITRGEAVKYKMLYSYSRRQLIFPFYGVEKQLQAYQARNFHPDYPKYYTEGNVEDVFWIVNLTGREKRGIILVEDVISAIKVGRWAAAMPLLGSRLSIKRRQRLSYLTSRLIFWLDNDKAMESCKFAASCQVFGIEAGSIITEKDPKEYSDDDIRGLLTGVNY